MLKISNLTYKDIFKSLNIEVKDNKWTAIIGKSSSGKTLLFKILLGIIKTESISLNDKILTEEDFILFRQDIGFIFENPNHQLIKTTAFDELMFSLENKNLDDQTTQILIKEIVELLEIDDILNKDITKLSGGQKQMVSIACALIIKPKYLLLDNFASMLDGYEKNKVIKILKKLKNTTVITFGSSLSDAIESNYVVVLSEKILYNSTKKLLLNSNELVSLGFDIPFEVDIFNKLKYYNLVKKPIFSLDKLVDEIWK